MLARNGFRWEIVGGLNINDGGGGEENEIWSTWVFFFFKTPPTWRISELLVCLVK